MQLGDLKITYCGMAIDIEHVEGYEVIFWPLDGKEKAAIRAEAIKFINGSQYFRVWSDYDHEEPSDRAYYTPSDGKLITEMVPLIQAINDDKVIYLIDVEDDLC